MRELHDRVINGLETLARGAGQELKVEVHRPYDVWLIMFRAGEAAVQTPLTTFMRAPRIVLEPFTEELIRSLR